MGSLGSDAIDGGNGSDTLDYTGAGVGGVTLLNLGVIEKGVGGADTIDGGNTGLVPSIQTIIGDSTETNAIDGSPVGGFGNNGAFNVDLAAESLQIANVDGAGTNLNFEVVNFVNVTGTQNSDRLRGDNEDNILTGGAGTDATGVIVDGIDINSDVVNGRGGNDTLIGVDPTSATPGFGEIDFLFGGSGSDTFVLADDTTPFYFGDGDTGFAFIRDFNFSQDTIDLGSLSSGLIETVTNAADQVFSGTFAQEIFFDGDLIAGIQV